MYKQQLLRDYIYILRKTGIERKAEGRELVEMEGACVTLLLQMEAFYGTDSAGMLSTPISIIVLKTYTQRTYIDIFNSNERAENSVPS